ncbi:gamma-glutamyl-gamma-aminobutyrate hydrolase family protein [Usitatibacter palustris]|uniref:Glutamine amidotransferase n=1 Tax=Usitatibacter palustris TaxID=2732487 RepID=A0A6M4H4A5_9PROT|nr:type 1 glutamine amidotransferase [Usitatibacter palustris]QJR14346.1 Putative glutamine amidotransferase [Usitatibacter palustris]
MDPLKIGISARLLYPDPTRQFLPTKTVQYMEQSAANWVMSGGVLAFMVPEMSLASPHLPNGVTVKDYVNQLDGLVLQGGADIAPETYRETPMNPAWSGDRIRDQYEIELFHEFVRQGKPVFGICRGCQLINVALGGTLYQDLATQLPDSGHHRHDTKYEHNFHDMCVLPDTWLSGLYPQVSRTRINTIHHQAVKTLGEGLVVEAKSDPDDVVEAVRWEGHSFVVGVQWHPEFMDPGDVALMDGKPLLKAFLDACTNRKKTGKASPVLARAA